MNLQRKADQYRAVLHNTERYRQAWQESLQQTIVEQLTHLAEVAGLHATVELRNEMNNLQAVVLDLGESKSGLFQQISEDLQRHLAKSSGSLIYQQLFNGKVIVLINYPYIENYGQPRPPKTIGIYRPEELREPFFVRHMEDFLTEITAWEDYDDDEPIQRIGFHQTFNLNTEQQDGRKTPLSGETESKE